MRAPPRQHMPAARPWPLTASAVLVLMGGLLALICLFVPWQIEHPIQDVLIRGYVPGPSSALRDCFLGWGLLLVEALAVIEGGALLLRGRRMFPGTVVVPFAIAGLLIALLIIAYLQLGYIDSFHLYQPTLTPAPFLTLLGLLLVCAGRIWWGIAALPPAPPDEPAPTVPSGATPQ